MKPSNLFWMAAVSGAAIVVVATSCGDDGAADTATSSTSSTSGAGGGGTGGGGGSGPTGASILSQSEASEFETNPTLAVVEGGRIAIAWVAHPAGAPKQIGYTTSDDDGANWAPLQFLASPDGEDYDSPNLTADRDGFFHLTWLGARRDASGGHVYASQATGTGELGEPVLVTDPEVVGFYERPRIAVTKKGSVMVAYGQLTDGRSSVVAATRAAGQPDWVRTVVGRGEQDDARRPFVCAPASGGAAIGRTWIAYSYDTYRAQLAYTDDDGISFPGGSRINFDEEPAGANVTCVGDGNEVWVSYGVLAQGRKYGELQQIRVAHSIDGGDSWIDYVDAHDAEAAPYFANQMLALESDGSLDLAYYAGAGQGDSIGKLLRTHWQQEAGPPPEPPGEGGAPPGKPSDVVHEPVGFSLIPTDDEWIGDSLGFAWVGGNLYAAYVDNSNIVSHVAFANVGAP